MNKIIQYIALSFCVCAVVSAQTQTGSGEITAKKGAVATRGVNIFPPLQFNEIPGAPKLSAPQRINGSEQQVVAKGHGIAAPAFYDMDGDGLKDLLVGEFASGLEHEGKYYGNFIRVYRNTGTEKRPKFAGSFEYARPPFEYKSMANGTPYSIDQYCCMGFTPQFVDLDLDGKMDMISGQYQGEVIWFRGTDKGFLPGQELRQEGDGEPRGSDWTKTQDYWLYSSASFGDFSGDGLPDLITGGASLRISRNIGTKDRPTFGHRELLLDIKGQALKIYEYTKAEKEDFKKYVDAFGYSLPVGGNDKISPYVVDWDNDGTLDLLVTNSFSQKGLNAIDFFKGVKNKNGIRFQQPVALFTAKDGSKAFPGSAPRVFVTDYNNDGVNDLLIGTSMVTMNGVINSRFSWNWEVDENIHPAGKDPANLFLPKIDLQRYKDYNKDKLPNGLSIDNYMTIRHEGIVYVLLGHK